MDDNERLTMMEDGPLHLSDEPSTALLVCDYTVDPQQCNRGGTT